MREIRPMIIVREGDSPEGSVRIRECVVISKSATIRPQPNAREIIRAALVRSYSRLPTHLAHPLKDERAVVIHALGSSLQGSRQNRSEPCRLLRGRYSGPRFRRSNDTPTPHHKYLGPIRPR